MAGNYDDGDNRRQAARRARRDAGDASARLASQLMQLPASSLAKLDLDEDLRAEVARARAVTAMSARRRAERTLAGALRRVDLDELAKQLDNLRTTGVADVRRLHVAERWRTRLLDDDGAVEAFRAELRPETHETLPRLVAEARRERTTGRPPGAARALFRHITAALDAAAKQAAAAADEGDGDDDGDD